MSGDVNGTGEVALAVDQIQVIEPALLNRIDLNKNRGRKVNNVNESEKKGKRRKGKEKKRREGSEKEKRRRGKDKRKQKEEEALIQR